LRKNCSKSWSHFSTTTDSRVGQRTINKLGVAGTVPATGAKQAGCLY